MAGPGWGRPRRANWPGPANRQGPGAVQAAFPAGPEPDQPVGPGPPDGPERSGGAPAPAGARPGPRRLRRSRVAPGRAATGRVHARRRGPPVPGRLARREPRPRNGRDGERKPGTGWRGGHAAGTTCCDISIRAWSGWASSMIHGQRLESDHWQRYEPGRQLRHRVAGPSGQ
jgi:hypothetical protein